MMKTKYIALAAAFSLCVLFGQAFANAQNQDDCSGFTLQILEEYGAAVSFSDKKSADNFISNQGLIGMFEVEKADYSGRWVLAAA